MIIQRRISLKKSPQKIPQSLLRLHFLFLKVQNEVKKELININQSFIPKNAGSESVSGERLYFSIRRKNSSNDRNPEPVISYLQYNDQSSSILS